MYVCGTNVVASTNVYVMCNVPTYAIMGMTVTFTNAPSSANYVFALDNSYLPWNNAGIIQNGGGYSWTTELDRYQTGGGPEGSAIYTFGTQYQVYLVTDFVESNAWVFVNPPSPSIDPTADALVNDPNTNSFQAVYSNGEGADACPAKDCVGNAAQAWTGIIVGQYSSCPGATQPGYMITKLAASTNYADVYNWLNPAIVFAADGELHARFGQRGRALDGEFHRHVDDPVGTITTWVWAFGDGGVSSLQNPSHTYAAPGAYTVSLSVTNSCGDGSATSATATVNVYDPYAWWRQEYFGNTNGASGAPGVDAYGTGMSNTNKFLAGFSGTNAAAYLHVISVAKAVAGGSTNVTVTYLGANGDSSYTPGFASRTNILEYTPAREWELHE